MKNLLLFDPTNTKYVNSESDVEAKLVLPLLSASFGYSVASIATKNRLAPTAIDKGAAKHGYLPDFVISLSGIPRLVVETKYKEELSGGLREARMYAGEVNKRFPSGVNPVVKVMAIDEREVMVCDWDSEASILRVLIADLFEGSAAFEELRKAVSSAALELGVETLRAQLKQTVATRPLQLVGTPSRQAEHIASNTFAAELAPLLRRYFDSDVDSYSREMIEKVYCASDELTKYNAELESLLNDRLSHGALSPLQTRRTDAFTFDQALRSAGATSDALILLVGSVGAGKSFFYRRYFEVLIPDSLKRAIKVLRIDLNLATGDKSQNEDWILTQILEEWRKAEGDEFDTIENLKRIFSVDVNRLRIGPLKALAEHSPEQYEIEIGKRIEELTKNTRRFCSQAIRHYAGDKSIPVIIFFDNADKRTSTEQLEIFSIVQKLRTQLRCISVLALRDETFDAFKNVPPLDTYQKPFAFRILPPRFTQVAKKRLELALADLTDSQKKRELPLSRGARVTYSTNKLPDYLRLIYQSVFGTHRRTGQLLEAISGKDVRRSLEMFCEILRSGYLSGDAIFKSTKLFESENSDKHDVPEWIIIRVLMRGQRRFFSSHHGYLVNIFDVASKDRTADTCLRSIVLEMLTRRRKERNADGFEGFVQIQDLCVELQIGGYSPVAVADEVNFLVTHGALSADATAQLTLQLTDYVRVSAAGYFLVRLLAQRLEYLSNCAFDFPCPDIQIARDISRYNTDSYAHRNGRAARLIDTYRATADSKDFAKFTGGEVASVLAAVRDRMIKGTQSERTSNETLDLQF